MKATKKTPRRAKTRRDNDYNEENIFNPFSPLLAWLKKPGKKKQEYSEHPFRDSFITVVLLHVIAVLSFLAYGAIKDATKSPTARGTTKSATDSRVAGILAKQPQLLPSEGAKPGEKLLAVREPDPFPTETVAAVRTKTAESAKTNRGANAAQMTSEEPLPPVTSAPKSVASAKPAVLPSRARDNDATKEKFLAASGRLPQAEQVASSIDLEIRRAEPVAKTKSEPSSPEQAAIPAVSEYTVQPGDNIFTISRRMNVSFTELAAANNLTSPREIRVGQTLVRPSADQL
jgi:LysM repeat protein